MTALPTIGASELAVTCGLQRLRRDGTPYESELELWARLRGLLPRYDSERHPAAEAGRIAEPGILVRAGQELDLFVAPGPQIPAPGLATPEIPWLAVRPDGIGWRGNGTIAASLEGKAPRSLDQPMRDRDAWGPVGTDQVPVYYGVQALGQVAVLYRVHGIEVCHVAAHARDGRRSERLWGIWTIRRDTVAEQRLLDRGARWYDAHVVRGLPPLPDGSESASSTLARIFKPRDVSRQLADDDRTRWRRLLEIRGELDELGAELRRIEQHLQARLGDATELVDGTQRLATWRARTGSTRIDIARLRRERPDIVRDYAETGAPSRTWRIGG